MSQKLQQTAVKRKKNVTKNGANGSGTIGLSEPAAIQFGETYRRATIKHAKTLFDYLQKNHSATSHELLACLPDAIPLVAFEAATDYLEEKGLIDFNASSQTYQLKAGAEWISDESESDNLSEKVDVSTTNGNGPIVQSTDEFKFLSISLMLPSGTVPQAERRKRINDASLDEITASIREKGVIEPLIVRRNKSTTGNGAVISEYEIVCGERRWLASKKAGRKDVPVIIRDLTDDQVLEVQLDENLHRQDVHPLDEAVWYAHLQERLNLNLQELGLRVGKNEKHVANRLKLNELSEETRSLLAKDLLPISHALEIAKFSRETQKEIIPLSFDNKYENGWKPDFDKPRTLKALREKIDSEILLSLKDAPFSTKATNLRADGLACVKCSERTGAGNLLFEEYIDKKNDRCLNKACYQGKLKAFVLLERDKLTEQAKSAGKFGDDYKAPLISWMPANRDEAVRLFNENILIDGDYRDVGDSSCDDTEPGIFIDSSWRFGKTINICRNQSCKTHKRYSPASTSSANGSGKDKAEFYKRKQEIFDVRVGEPVRRKVLKEAASNFDGENTIFNHAFSERFMLLLLSRLWELQVSYSDHTAKVIAEILELKKNDLSFERWGNPNHLKLIEALTAETRSRLFFLLLVAHQCELFPENAGSWKSQDVVLQIAKDFSVDYQKLDAGERLTQAPKKYFSAAQDYFNAIERGEKPKKPVFYKVETAKEAANG